MLRDFAKKKTLIVQTVDLLAGEVKTLECPEADQIRMTAVFPDPTSAGAALLFRAASANEDGSVYAADAVDAGVNLSAADTVPLTPSRPSSEWIDAQPPAVRVQALVDPITVVFEYTAPVRPTFIATPV